MRAVGLQLGGMLRRLHDAGIYYNDATLADPQGRSHLIVDDEGRCVLIDFGVSLLVNHHPDYSREEVHNFARTLPMYRVMAGMAEGRSEMDQFLVEYGRRMAEVTPADIMARDLKFAQQGPVHRRPAHGAGHHRSHPRGVPGKLPAGVGEMI